jgi:DeoR/GlpR family transcriptional regulator of sugar metabolism
LKQDGFTSIDHLARTLDVSRSTVRRDLFELQQEGILECVHGGAMMASNKSSYEPPFKVRYDRFRDEKKRIAAFAATLVKENETLLLDSGTTIGELAAALDKRQNLYVATNDMMIAMSLAENENINLTVLGGSIRRHHFSLYGYFTENMLKQIHADKVFLGVDAVDFQIGFMNFSVHDVQAKKLMIETSNETIILCDHSKFESIAFVKICSFDQVDLVITGKEISENALSRLKELDVDVMTV